MDTIGDRLKSERERLGLNQTEFGDAGGVQKNAQLKYEKNERCPDLTYLEGLAAIGVDALYVLTGKRGENIASTPIELSYLRICRALPDQNARMAGNAALVALLTAFGGQMNTMQASNDSSLRAAQPTARYNDTEGNQND